MAAMAAEHSNDKAYASILQQFRTALLSDEYLAYTFIQDVHIYHQLNGMALNEGEHAYDVELPIHSQASHFQAALQSLLFINRPLKPP